MMAALIDGERDPKALAQLARTRLRAKLPALEQAFVGHFTDHHAFLLRRMLARIDGISADIAELQTRIDAEIAPFGAELARLVEIPGIGPVAAQVLIAEIGLDMTRFPTAGHLASWARFAPTVKESAGRPKGGGSTGHGNRYLARILGEAAVVTGRTRTFLGERYRRIARRRGKKKAIVAIGRSILLIVWHLLTDPTARFHDLGTDFYDTRPTPNARSATTCANSKRSATGSHSNRSPDPSLAAACHVDFRIRRRFAPLARPLASGVRRWGAGPSRRPSRRPQIA